MRWALIGLLLALLGAGLALRQGWLTLPERFDPWAPLRFEAPPDRFTRFRLARLSADAPACAAFLATTPFRYETLTDRVTGPGCGFANAVRIDALPEKIGTPFALTCRTAASLALWMKHVVEPAAREWLDSPVERLDHFGSYACRNVNHATSGSRSQHATADALDVAGFVLANGRRVRVLRDWPATDPESQFLHAVRDGACRYFDGTLSPDYNAAHRDHLHLDRGPYRLCR